jgi:hypothetical protein
MTDEAIPEVVVTAPADATENSQAETAQAVEPGAEAGAAQLAATLAMHKDANLQTAKDMVADGAKPEHAADWLYRQAAHIWESVEHALADILG